MEDVKTKHCTIQTNSLTMKDTLDIDSEFPTYSHSTTTATPTLQPVQLRSSQFSPFLSRFSFKTDKEVEEAKQLATPHNTARNTSWAVKVWKDWTDSFPGQLSEWPTHLYLAMPQQMNYWLCKFVLEGRKANGDHYPPNTLYSICCGLLRYV